MDDLDKLLSKLNTETQVPSDDPFQPKSMSFVVLNKSDLTGNKPASTKSFLSHKEEYQQVTSQLEPVMKKIGPNDCAGCGMAVSGSRPEGHYLIS